MSSCTPGALVRWAPPHLSTHAQPYPASTVWRPGLESEPRAWLCSLPQTQMQPGTGRLVGGAPLELPRAKHLLPSTLPSCRSAAPDSSISSSIRPL